MIRNFKSLFKPKYFSARFFQGTKAQEAYLFVYTCKVCEHRSERKISKHAYHKGVGLVKCPSCSKNHLVADNLGWFEDTPINVEQLAERQGEAVWKGLVHMEGMSREEIDKAIQTRIDTSKQD